ncbi:MAG: hypothetical protein HOP31_14115 [Ignavibacteria bacterium]|nr:hypothetical protein [Ignavibacteria bacterium]
MKKSKTNPKVDWYFSKSRKWQEEINILRDVILSSGLNEELKWGCPCYTLDDRNIVLIHVFKEYCAVLFFKGALLKDQENILVQQTKNVQSGRQMRFISLAEVKELKPVLKAYISEAVTAEKAGLKVEFKKTAEYDIPEEFQIRLDEDAALKKAFYALTPGRQRGYLLYFSAAKQSKTREARVEKYVNHILKGKGMDDK